MHIHTSIYAYIFITACGPLIHQRVMSGRRIIGFLYIRTKWGTMGAAIAAGKIPLTLLLILTIQLEKRNRILRAVEISNILSVQNF